MPESASARVLRRGGLSLLGLWLLLGVSPLRAADSPQWPATPVRVVEAVEVELAPQHWLAATVVSRREARIAAETGGRLLSVVEVGSRVEQGEALARSDATFVKLKMDELTAAVAREEARLEFLRSEQRRLSRLARQNNTAQTQLDEVESKRLAALNELSIARTRLAEAAEELRRHVLLAPFAGVVVERNRREGEWVAKGDAVLRLVDISSLEARASAPLSARRFVHAGDRLPVQADGVTASGVVRALVPAADLRSHRLDLRVSLSGDGWTVGQPLRVAIPAAAATTVLAVPRDALVLRSRGTAVFRIDAAGKAEHVAVTPGVASGELIAVSGDLRPGDRVVVRGGERLQPGQAVRILPDGE